MRIYVSACRLSICLVCLSVAAAFAKQFLMHKTFLSATLTVAREKQVSLTLVHRFRPGQKLGNKKMVKIKDTQVSPRNAAIFSSFNRFINKSI